MKQKILGLGRRRIVVIITLVSIFLAIVSDYFIAKLLGHNFSPSQDLLRAGIIPLLIAPFISWYLVGLLFELEKLEKEMNVLATFDDLTGVYNRRAFYKISECLHTYSLNKKEPYSLLIIDLDLFKRINDTYGHSAGDKVLQSFSQIAKELSRSSDILGRIGGEEFAFFLPNTTVQQARRFSQRLLTGINAAVVNFEEKPIRFSVSIGICIHSGDHDTSLHEVLQNADKALYQAKENGRNQVSIFSS